MQLFVHPAYDITSSEGFCEGYSYTWGEMELTLPGTYLQTFQTQYGCDSIVELELYQNASYAYYDTLMFCSNEEISWQGQLFNAPGDYLVDYTTVENCDSSYYLHLMEIPAYHFDEYILFCKGDVVEWQGMEYDVQGEYYAYYQSIDGCDSNYQLILEWSIPDTMVFISGDSLYVTADEQSTYQWLTCGVIEKIEGATDPVYVVDYSGSYAVIVEKNGCIDTSKCHYIIYSNTETTDISLSMNVFPNPSIRSSFQVKLNKLEGEYSWQLMDRTGVILMDRIGDQASFLIDEVALAPGVYFLVLRTNGRELIRKLIVP
jgi:hypothetical protein